MIILFQDWNDARGITFMEVEEKKMLWPQLE